MENKYKIVAVLKYGRVWGRWMAFFSWFFVGFTFTLIPLIIFIAIHFYEYRFFFGFTFPLLGLMFLPLCIRNTRLIFLIKTWAKEAVLHTAEIEIVNEEFFLIGAFSGNPVRIKISFRHNGKNIKRLSGDDKKKYSFPLYGYNGYDRIFNRFVGKKVEILYHEGSDQILFFE